MATITSDKRASKTKLDNKLVTIKSKIKGWHDYFEPNYNYYNMMTKFVFDTSLSETDISMAKELGRPTLEANISEAYISRLLGEFSKQEPSVEVRKGHNSKVQDPKIVPVVEGFIRAAFYDSNRDNMLYNLYRDCLAGGFSAMKVFTDYVNEMSFDQNILMRRVFDPTLTGFDKFARESHKGDGNFCYELYPYTKEDFEAKWGSEYTKTMKFRRDIEGFNWSYRSDKQDIVLIGDFYEKRKKKAKIVQLIDKQVMTVEEYEKFVARWNSSPNNILPPPGVVGRPRDTEITTIYRSVMIENAILEDKETDYKYLPIIFFGGNPILVRESVNGAARELTRSYIHHGVGTQKLKNFSMMSLANHLENMMQSKLMAPVEAIPPQYIDAYKNPQKASVYLYNQYKDNDPNQRLDPPQVIQTPALPPEVINTFNMCDQVMQSILGNYDAALGINDNQLSGVAIVEGATQSNAAAMPFIVGFMKGLNRAAQIIVDLIPKYMVTPRDIPINDLKNKRQYVTVNDVNSPQLNYESNDLDVMVEAGVNFEIQKNRSLQSMEGLMKVSPLLAEFIGTDENGIEMLLDNVKMNGIDALKQGIKPFIAQKKQQMEMMQQMQMQSNPAIIKMKELQQKAQKDQMDAQLESARISVENREADTNQLLAFAAIGEKADRITLDRDKIDAENARTATEAAVDFADMRHSHTMDLLNRHHDNEISKLKSQGRETGA